MASIEDIARDFTALLRAGEFETAGGRLWSPDVTNTEPASLPPGQIAKERNFHDGLPFSRRA